MATQQTVWFAADSDKWFNTEAKALAYEKQQALIDVMRPILNEDAAKKAAKAILAVYTLTPKVV
jgi:hypothetical protein